MASIFVSYSHLDESWKDRLLRHFKVFEQQGLAVSAWHDRKIPGGGDWDAEIRRAMAEADAAVLLVSTDFLGSEFINEVEVPFLLDRREREGLPVIPVVVLPCNWKMVPWLKKLNLRPRDAVPISAGTENEIEVAFAGIAEEAFRFVTGSSKLPPASGRPATRADWHLVHPYGMPPNFTGRLAERRMLSDWLVQKDGPALLMLRALGGFGKTALVWHWLGHDVEPARWSRVVWWSFYDESSFDEFLREALGYLGLDGQGLGAREGVRQLIGVLQRSNVLLVLDGFERTLRAFGGLGAEYQGDLERKGLDGRGADCVSPAAEAFLLSVSSLQDHSGRVLLTTRIRPRVFETRVGELLAGCQEINLRELDRSEAVEFFYAEGIRGNRAEIEAACAQYGFHPLCLRLLAGLIVKDLQQPGDIRAAEQLDVSGDLIQRQHHVLAQSYTSLPAEGKRLLSRIACFRGAVRYETLIKCLQKQRQPRKPWFLRLFAGDQEEVLDLPVALQDLASRGLLHHDERDGRFDLHPIVRRYAYDFLGVEEREAAHRDLRDYFAAVPPLDKVKALTDLAPAIELYHHMVMAGEYDASFEHYIERLRKPILWQLGAFERGIELMHVLFPAGEDRPPRLRRVHSQSLALGCLAIYYSHTGQPQRGMQLFERSSDAAGRIGDKAGFAKAQANLASLVLAPVGALRRAEIIFRSNIKYSGRESSAFDEAYCRQELGSVLLFLGRWAEAKSELEAGRLTFEEEDYTRHLGISSAYNAHLNLLRHRSRKGLDLPEFKEQALADANRALELADKCASMNDPSEREYVRAHWLLGAAFRENRMLDGAERHLSEALERCRRISLIDSEADILIDLGRLRRIQGDGLEARRLGEEAAAIAERCGYAPQEADAHLLLALLEKEAGNLDQARDHAARARELATCDGPPDYTYKVAYDGAGALLAELG